MLGWGREVVGGGLHLHDDCKQYNIMMSEEEKYLSLLHGEASLDKDEEEELLREANISLENGQWQLMDMQDHCAEMKEWAVCQLSLGSNAYKAILHNIQHISFPSLKHIILSQNNIESIQPLCLIYLPCLDVLMLGENRIMSMSCLKKANCYGLKWLTINKNSVLEGGWMSELPFPTFQVLKLEWMYDPEQINNIGWVVKLQSSAFSELRIKSSSRIKQARAYRKIKEKYPQIKLNTNI